MVINLSRPVRACELNQWRVSWDYLITLVGHWAIRLISQRQICAPVAATVVFSPEAIPLQHFCFVKLQFCHCLDNKRDTIIKIAFSATADVIWLWKEENTYSILKLIGFLCSHILWIYLYVWKLAGEGQITAYTYKYQTVK